MSLGFLTWLRATGEILTKNNGENHGSNLSTPRRGAGRCRVRSGRCRIGEYRECSLHGSQFGAPAEPYAQYVERRVSPCIGFGLGDDRVRRIRLDCGSVENRNAVQEHGDQYQSHAGRRSDRLWPGGVALRWDRAVEFWLSQSCRRRFLPG